MPGKTEFFFHLSPEKVLDALERAGLQPAGQCMILNSMENRVYQVVLETGETVVAKFYRPGRWGKEQIQEEHDLLFLLKKEEVPVCEPLVFDNGSSIAVAEGIYFSAWPLTGGREPAELTEEQLQMLGRLLGRMHSIAATKPFQYRTSFNEDQVLMAGWQNIKDSELLPGPMTKDYQSLVTKIYDKYQQLAVEVPVQPIHGDCHLGNIIQQGEKFLLLDFDDCCTGPVVQDLWMLLQYTGAGSARELQCILDGYRQFADFSDHWIQLIEACRAIRMVHYSGWVSKRWSDPAFKSALPHFGAEQYWLDELELLRKQVTLLYGEPETAIEDGPELTNKDFFWDMED